MIRYNHYFLFLTFLVALSSCKKKDAPVLEITSISSEVQMISYSVEVEYEGGDVQGRGICYSTTNEVPNVLDDEIASAGDDNGSWEATVDGFQTSTTYYIRAYMTTGTGTDYSQAVAVTLDPAWVNMGLIVSNEILSISVVDENTVHAGTSWGEYASTIDGGENWTVTEMTTSSDIENIHFVNSMLGFQTEFNTTYRKTVDGGQNWTSNLTGGAGHGSGIFFLDENTGFISREYSGQVAKTVDGGTNWTIAEITIDSGDKLEDIHFPGASAGYVVSNNGQVFKSTDLGESWTLQNSSPIGANCIAIHFTTETSGFVISGNSIYMTSDGGGNWTSVYVASDLLMDVHFVNESVGVACGENGTLLRTDDGGNSWEKLPTTMGNYTIYQVEMATPDIGYASSYGRILKYH